MSYVVRWDRDRLRIHDDSGREADRDLPIDQLLTWLGASGVAACGAPASHTHAYVPLVEATRIEDPTGGTTADAEARTAIAAILDILEARGMMAAAE